MQSLIQLLTVTRSTLVESIRQPIFAVCLLAGITWLTLNLYLSAYTFDNDDIILINTSLSSLMIFGTFLAAFTAAGVITHEITNKTILTIISKPISRPVFLTGKYLGISLAISLAMLVWSCVLLLTLRHRVLSMASMKADYPVILFTVTAISLTFVVAGWTNYAYNWNFTATLSMGLVIAIPIAWVLVLFVSKQWQIQNPTTDLNWPTLMALLMAWQLVWLITAVAVAAATRCSLVQTLVITMLVFAAGLLNSYLFGRYAQTSWPAALAYHALPDLQVFWIGDAVAEGSIETTLTRQTGRIFKYLLLTSVYAASYTFGILALAVALFQKREAG